MKNLKITIKGKDFPLEKFKLKKGTTCHYYYGNKAAFFRAETLKEGDTVQVIFTGKGLVANRLRLKADAV